MSTSSPGSCSSGSLSNLPDRWCIVSECKNSSVTAPEKLWIEVPNDFKMWTAWLTRASRDPKNFTTSKSPVYFCEDHFDLEKDMENYEEYKTTGSVELVRMKPDCMPTRFGSQISTEQPTQSEAIQPQLEVCPLAKDMENHEQYKTTGTRPTKFDCQTSVKQTTASEDKQHKFEVYAPMKQPLGPPSKVPIVLPPKGSHLTQDDTCQKADPTDIDSATMICICCLQNDGPFVKMVTCDHTEFLHSMKMIEIKPNKQVICYQCHHMLKKIKLFKLQVEESFKLLSDSAETKPIHTNQIYNFKIRQNFNINIPPKGIKAKPVRVYTEVPHVRIKPNENIDDNITKEKTEPEKRPNQKSPNNKQSKYIEEALKIISNNQNSDCINLLANSLKNISSTLLSDILNNFDLVSNVAKTIKRGSTVEGESLQSNITPTWKEKVQDAKEKIAFEIDSLKLAAKLTVPTENLFKDLGEKASKAETTNVAQNQAICKGNLKNKIEDALMTDTTKIAAPPEIPISLPTNIVMYKENLANAAKKKLEIEALKADTTKIAAQSEITISMPTNLANNTEENSPKHDLFNNYNKKKPLTPEDIGRGVFLPKVNPKITEKPVISTEEIVKQEDPVSITDKIIGRIITEHYSMADQIPGEESSQPVTVRKEYEGLDQQMTQDTVGDQPVTLKDESVEVDQQMTQDTVGDQPVIVKVESVKVDQQMTQDTVGDHPVIVKVESVKVEQQMTQDTVGDQPVIVKEESVEVYQTNIQESVGEGENIVQAVEAPIALYPRPSLGDNIKQLTLTRKQLMDERAKIATSQAYLRAPQKCTSCLIGFQFEENLKDHVKRKHTIGNRPVANCDVCHQLVDLGPSIEFHAFWHYTRYQCVACEQLFATYDKAAHHYKKHHTKAGHDNVKPGLVFRCPRCTYKTNSHRLLKRHMSCVCRPAPTEITLETLST